MKLPVLFFSFLVVVTTVNILPQAATAQIITTIAGCGIGNDSLSTKAELIGPMKIAFDNAGNAYIADLGNKMIRKVDAGGVITTYAGTGAFGSTGDGGPATAATFEDIFSVATDRIGNVYIADAVSNSIRKINTSGIITTVAGTGIAGYNGDGIAATAAQLNEPSDIVADTSGNIYIADRMNYLVREVNTSGIITTVPGTSGLSGIPFRITLDKYGNVFIATYYSWNILKDTAGVLVNIAGTGSYGYSGDGGPATAATFSAPCGIAIDSAGNVYISDIDHERVRMINATTGTITTIAGNGIEGISGDGGIADSAQISGPEGISFDANNNLYVSDLNNNRIRRVSTAGIIATFAGQNGLFDEGYPGINSEITLPNNITTDASGNVYIADISNQRIRMVNAATGVMTTVAGTGISGYENGFSGDGGPADSAHLSDPLAVAVDIPGNIYICDGGNERIRMINTAGIISTIAGNGTMGGTGNGIPATAAELNYPCGIAVDPAGNVYISDNGNNEIRKINTSGIISVFAGNERAGYFGDGGLAIDAELNNPADVASDGLGNIYIADAGNNRVRKVDVAGTITTVAGGSTPGFSGDGSPATAALLTAPGGVKADAFGNIYIADGSNRVRIINSGGIINTIAGTGTAGFSGDGGPAIDAMINGPAGVAVDLSGNVFIADGYNERVRKVNVSYLSVPSTKTTQQNMLVYPNPTNGTINIVNAANSLVIVNDIAGNKVMKAPIINATQTLDISGLASGVYLVQVINNNGESKIVKVTKE